jgi:deoxyribose-phosphate aldolase
LPTTNSDLAQAIDHSILGPATTDRELEAGSRIGLERGVASVCVLPYFVPRLTEILGGSVVRVSTTIGFPHGAHSTRAKLAETEQAMNDGAVELDAVVNISKVMSDDFAYVAKELALLTNLVHERGQKIKVIFETAYLDEARKIALSRIVSDVGADWAKTSTGFGPSGATVADVELLRAHCAPHVAIKASGGIRDLDTLLALQTSGATRIGTSQTVAILEEWQRRGPTRT